MFYNQQKNDSGIRSAYAKDNSSTDNLFGIRIGHNISFNACRHTAPFYITIYDLSEEELPSSACPDDVLPVVLSVLCYGSSQDCSNSSIGYVIFLRSTTKESEISTDQENHQKYRQDVFLPFVQNCRQYYLQKEGWLNGDAIDDEHLWVGWQVCFNYYLRYKYY